MNSHSRLEKENMERDLIRKTIVNNNNQKEATKKKTDPMKSLDDSGSSLKPWKLCDIAPFMPKFSIRHHPDAVTVTMEITP